MALLKRMGLVPLELVNCYSVYSWSSSRSFKFIQIEAKSMNISIFQK